MDRRELLKTAAGAAALGALARPAGVEAAAAPAAAPAAPAQFTLDAYSRNLQWLRTPAELAKGVTELGLKSVDVTVLPNPGHVDPARAGADLRPFVDGLRQNGITVRAITTPIVDAATPGAEAILDAAAQAGVRYYGWSGLAYDERQPYRAQVEALKPRLAALARLNEKYRIKGLYQPRAGSANVGSSFYDLLEVMRAHDPRFLGLRYDTAALLQATPAGMVSHLRHGGPYIGGLAVTDARVQLELPVWEEGPYNRPAEHLLGASSGGDNVGRDRGDPLAYGGGGRPLPYRFRPARVGTGMVDLTLLGKTLKEIGFDGPAETQITWALDGVENGGTRITKPRQYVIGEMKRERLIVEQAFAEPWGIDIARPPFMRPGAQRPAGGADD